MKKVLYYYTLSISLLISSCSSVYLPNVPNTPMLSSKGELSASGHGSMRGNVSFNSAYAVSDHFGVLLSGSAMNSNRMRKEFKNNLLETGAGYFTTFGANKDRILEIYTGLGHGSTDRTFKDKSNQGLVTVDRQEVTFNKYFMQVNYSSKDKKNLKLFNKEFPLNYGTAMRVSYVNMNEFIRNDINQIKEDNVIPGWR